MSIEHIMELKERFFSGDISLDDVIEISREDAIEELRVALQNKLHEEFTLTGADINEVAEKLKENK